MNSLIAISNGNIGGETVQTVNARDLHAFLNVGKDFSTWIKTRIESFGFVENHDFAVFPEIGGNPAGGRPSKDYHLTLTMAKELAMVERNAKGKEARLYFIECERQAKRAPAMIDGGLPLSVLEIMQKANDAIARETFAHINALRKDVDELKQTRATLAAPSYTEGWKPTHKVTPVNPESILYKRFVEVCGPNGNLSGWVRRSGIKLTMETVRRVIYYDHRAAPSTYIIIAKALGLPSEKIKDILAAQGCDHGLLSFL